jgi:hypothetical protein
MNSKFGDCCNCPALVDGRFFTEFRDRDYLQFNLMKQNNITNSNDFRNFLISNANNLISSNIGNIETNYKCNYNKPTDQSTMSADTSKYLTVPDFLKSTEVTGKSDKAASDDMVATVTDVLGQAGTA